MTGLGSHTLCLSELRSVPCDEPLVVTTVDAEGSHAAVALRMPSMRRDIVKLQIHSIIGTETKEIKLIEENRELVSGVLKYQVRQTRSEKERESALRILGRYKETE